MIKIRDLKDLVDIHPPTEAEIQDHSDGTPDCIVISPTNYRINLTSPISSLFNIDAIEVAVRDFLKAVKHDGWYGGESNFPPEDITEDGVRDAVETHFGYIWDVYQRLSRETPQESQERKSKVAKRTRKRQVS